MSTSLDKQAEKIADAVWAKHGFQYLVPADQNSVTEIVRKELAAFATQVREQTVQETITKIFNGGFYEIGPMEDLHKFLIAAPPETTDEEEK